MALDSSGNVHLVVSDGNSSGNRDIYYAKYDVDKNKWNNFALVYESPGLNSTWPRLDIEDDILYIVWTHNYDPKIGLTDVVMVSNPIGGSWPVPKAQRETISNFGQSVSVHNDFAIRNKRIYCTWLDDNHSEGLWNLYYNEGNFDDAKNAWVWGTSKQLFPSKAKQYYPGLAVDENGGAHIVFSGKNGPFRYTRKVGNTWTGPKDISTNGASFTLILSMKYSHGLLHTAWRQTTDNGEGIFYGRGLPDGTWAKPIMVGNGYIFPQYPVVDVDQDGDVHVVFSDGDPESPRHIYYSKVEFPGTPPEAVIKVNQQTGLIPFTVQFDGSQSTDPGGKILQYRWSFGDGTSASGKKVSHTYTQKGTFIASLSVVDSDFRVGTAEVEIVASTGEPFASIEASATQGMIPLTVIFDASASKDVDGEIVSYNWNFGDGASDEGVSVTHIYEGGGQFEASLTVVDNDGKSDTATLEISVYQKPFASFTATPEFGVAPLVVSFDASESNDVDGTIKNYIWDYGDGTTGMSKKENHTYSTPGTFLAVLTVRDNDGYTGTDTREIRILDKPLAPVNVAVERIVNKSFFFVDYINQVTWEDNPDNSGLFTISQYRIYRKGSTENQFVFAEEVSAGTLVFEDRKFADANEAAGFEYVVTAIDDQGKESSVSNPSTYSLDRFSQPGRIKSKNKIADLNLFNIS